VSARVSVCPSHCECIKTVRARITEFLLWAAAKTVVVRDKISSRWVKRFLSNEDVRNKGVLSKKSVFIAIDSSSVRAVAHRHNFAAYHNKHWRRAFRMYQRR